MWCMCIIFAEEDERDFVFEGNNVTKRRCRVPEPAVRTGIVYVLVYCDQCQGLTRILLQVLRSNFEAPLSNAYSGNPTHAHIAYKVPAYTLHSFPDAKKLVVPTCPNLPRLPQQCHPRLVHSDSHFSPQRTRAT